MLNIERLENRFMTELKLHGFGNKQGRDNTDWLRRFCHAIATGVVEEIQQFADAGDHDVK